MAEIFSSGACCSLLSPDTYSKCLKMDYLTAVPECHSVCTGFCFPELFCTHSIRNYKGKNVWERVCPPRVALGVRQINLKRAHYGHKPIDTIRAILGRRLIVWACSHCPASIINLVVVWAYGSAPDYPDYPPWWGERGWRAILHTTHVGGQQNRWRPRNTELRLA